MEEGKKHVGVFSCWGSCSSPMRKRKTGVACFMQKGGIKKQKGGSVKKSPEKKDEVD